MKVYHDGRAVVVELTRRNLEVLLAKLDDAESARTIMKYDPDLGWACVKAVPNEEHYADRPAGPMYMPSSGEWL